MLTLSDLTINPPTLNNGRNLTIKLTEDKRETRNVDVDSPLLTETLRNTKPTASRLSTTDSGELVQ